LQSSNPHLSAKPQDTLSHGDLRSEPTGHSQFPLQQAAILWLARGFLRTVSIHHGLRDLDTCPEQQHDSTRTTNWFDSDP